MPGLSKGDAAQPETKKRRAYHQAYYRARVTSGGFGRHWVECPSCKGRMVEGRKMCWVCSERLDRWDECVCGRRKVRRSKQCHVCAGRRPVGARVAPPPLDRSRNPFCPNPFEGGVCETRQKHRHCECGLPVPPDVQACAICLYEQSRIEFKRWPKEKVA